MQARLHSVPPILQPVTMDPHWRLLDIHTQVCVSFLWGHCSFLLCPGVHKVLFVSSKSLFPQSCVSSGSSSVGLFQEGLCRNKVCCTQSPCPCGGPLLTCTSAGDTQTIKGRPGSVSVGSSDVHKVLFEPSEHLWQVWGLILNMILPLLLSC